MKTLLMLAGNMMLIEFRIFSLIPLILEDIVDVRAFIDRQSYTCINVILEFVDYM